MTTTLQTTGVREIQFREAINECLRQEMELDENVIIMGEEIAGGAGRQDQGVEDAWGGPFRTTVGLIQQFGNDRVLDTPLSEAAFIGAAIGASSTGLRAVAELMFVDFIGVCMDQLVNNAAKMRYMFGGQVKVPFTMMTRIGAGFGAAAQHSESYYSIFSHFPGLKGVCPSDAYTAKGLLAASIRDDDPVVFFEPKRCYRGPFYGDPHNVPTWKGHEDADVPEGHYDIPLGQANMVQEGGACTVIAWGTMVHVAQQAIKDCGISCDLIDLQTLVPWDRDSVVNSVKKTGRVVVVHEAPKTSG